MHLRTFVQLLTQIEPVICLLILVALYKRSLMREYKFIGWYLLVRFTSDLVGLFLLSHAASHFNKQLRYHAYFVNYWVSYTLEVILGFGIIYSVYRLAMIPLPGLQKLGMVMFRWAAGISLAIALAMAFGPKVTSSDFLMRFIGQLQQTESVLTLCLLLFVCVTVSPMGLSVRSKIFGVCLGFGVNAATQLVSSAWFVRYPGISSWFSVVNGLVVCLSLGIWGFLLRHARPQASPNRAAHHIAVSPLEPDICRFSVMNPDSWHSAS